MHQSPAFHLPHGVRINMTLTVVKTVTDMVRNTFENLTQTKPDRLKLKAMQTSQEQYGCALMFTSLHKISSMLSSW